MIDQIRELSNKYWRPSVDIRRYLHMHPELSFNEKETSQYIESKLRKLPLDSLSRIDQNGLLGTIHGRDSGKTILLRADIDALPILEENQHDFVSKNSGVMHACGHDAHTSMLISAGKILCDLKESWNGTVKILFQPAEEKIPGGAPLMIKGGVLENPKPLSVVGQHVKPELEAGKVGVRPGKFMASSDEIYIKFIGKGGHGAMPEYCIDPVLIAGHFLVAAQQIVSRNANPKIPTVLSFGKIVGNGATNVIPDSVILEGTLRTLDEDWRKEALLKVKTLAIGLAESMGGKCEVDIAHGYPFLLNNEALALNLKKGMQEYMSPENVVNEDIWMAAEDFAYYSHELPSCFYLLGVGNKKKNITSGLHTPTFDIDEKAMEVGAGLMSFLAIRELQ
ncbi:M20 family metallopeptidase [Reichenbachiella sp. MALMAid0571]|uniref:M20 metallopeptidase family protein n=1 Tax=Reichenbachiella sp. MALMAid0571 TaxID=3143939 RepID=UPI0032DF34B8